MPAGLPCGMPGMGELMLGAMQQAPQCGRQSMPESTTPGRSAHGNSADGAVPRHPGESALATTALRRLESGRHR